MYIQRKVKFSIALLLYINKNNYINAHCITMILAFILYIFSKGKVSYKLHIIYRVKCSTLYSLYLPVYNVAERYILFTYSENSGKHYIRILNPLSITYALQYLMFIYIAFIQIFRMGQLLQIINQIQYKNQKYYY